VIGISAVIDPDTDDVSYCCDMPAWRPGILGALRHRLKLPVVIDNDVNLAATAERMHGAATNARSFVLVWIGRGPGSAVMIGDQLLRGAAGKAGEIGWMPVPGAPVGDGILDRSRGGIGAAFQTLVGWRAVQELADTHNISFGTIKETMEAATANADGATFLDELAHRIALGVASICTVLDPELIVLGSDVGTAGGDELADRVQQAIPNMCLAKPQVKPSTIPDKPVLHGALHTALDRARQRLFTGQP
jgi:predicted NBD/HSP70 family sugar kinase